MTIARINAAEKTGAGLITRPALIHHLDAPTCLYSMECFGKDGELKWREIFDNLVTTAGKNDLLTQYLKGVAYTAGWFVGLISITGYTAIAVGDTSASHAGWTESAAYAAATRPALVLGTPASASVDNSASKASFAINATTTIKGAFVISNNTKSGATGILYSAGLFAEGDRAVINGDTLQVQNTLTC